jgi:hypothetical protein
VRIATGSPTRAFTAWINRSRERRAAVNARLAAADRPSRLDRLDRRNGRSSGRGSGRVRTTPVALPPQLVAAPALN